MVVPGRTPLSVILLNAGITAALPEPGSLGASGDRAGAGGMAQVGA